MCQVTQVAVLSPINFGRSLPVSRFREEGRACASDGLHHEGGALVVGGRVHAVAVLEARRQLQPLVADFHDGTLQCGRTSGQFKVWCTGWGCRI